MAIKSFADTSAVSLAYAFTDAATATEVVATDFQLVPFTTEGFTLSKEAKTSQAISGSRRTRGSKNTKGTASGALTVEFGAVKFCLDMIQAALQSTWANINISNPLLGKFIHDSDKQSMSYRKANHTKDCFTSIRTATRCLRQKCCATSSNWREPSSSPDISEILRSTAVR